MMADNQASARSLFERVRTWLDGREPDDLGPVAAPVPVRVPAVPVPSLDRRARTGGEVPTVSSAVLSAPGDSPVIESLQAEISAAVRDPRLRSATIAFNASQPVGDRYELSGRLGELHRLTKAVIDGWQHAIIYGARGVGKTSLARVFGDLTDEAGCDVFYHSASGDAQFEDVIRPYLRFIEESSGLCGEGAGQLGERFGARDLVEILSAMSQRRVFLILDEFDRITDPRTRAELAALLKLLSDFRLPIQFVIVGISSDVDLLVAEHPSLRRHMAAIRVGPIRDEAMAKLLEEGARRADLRFEPKTTAAIIAVALGSPYHARLVALESALKAGSTAQATVGMSAFAAGVDEAWLNWASVSPATARTFARLGKTPRRMGLIAAAVAASTEYAFDEPHVAELLRNIGDAEPEASAHAALELLRPELRQVEQRVVFRDSLAPQFLLLAMIRSFSTSGREDFGVAVASICAEVRRIARVNQRACRALPI
jgi:hypothetical protein